MNTTYISTAAQVMPVLLLAGALEWRAIMASWAKDERTEEGQRRRLAGLLPADSRRSRVSRCFGAYFYVGYILTFGLLMPMFILYAEGTAVDALRQDPVPGAFQWAIKTGFGLSIVYVFTPLFTAIPDLWGAAALTIQQMRDTHDGLDALKVEQAASRRAKPDEL